MKSVKEYNWFLKLILPSNIIGITLCPFGIYVKDINRVTERTINHENIHWQQQLEMLVIFFYIWYLVEWIIKLFKYGGRSYRNLSFEREAYGNDKNIDYLKNRKHYSWFKYLLKKG